MHASIPCQQERGLALDPRPPPLWSRRVGDGTLASPGLPQSFVSGLRFGTSSSEGGCALEGGRRCNGSGAARESGFASGGWRVKLGRAVRLELERSVWLGEGPGQPGSLHLRWAWIAVLTAQVGGIYLSLCNFFFALRKGMLALCFGLEEFCRFKAEKGRRQEAGVTRVSHECMNALPGHAALYGRRIHACTCCDDSTRVFLSSLTLTPPQLMGHTRAPLARWFRHQHHHHGHDLYGHDLVLQVNSMNLVETRSQDQISRPNRRNS